MKLTQLFDAQPLPIVVEPDPREDRDLVEWIDANKAHLEAELLRVGGLLFRGFAVDSPARFRAVVERFEMKLLAYVSGNSPRTAIEDKIYTSTEIPPARTIPIHNELSYSAAWPARIFFFCLIAPEDRGETPIVDSRRVLARMAPHTRDKFEQLGVRYIQTFHGGTGAVGKSWQAAFETEDRATAETLCRERQIAWEWLSTGGLRLIHHRPATATHPITGERVWFNQADLWHPASLAPATLKALPAALAKIELPNHACFGDGSEIGESELADIRQAHEAEQVVFPWRTNDVLVLDNMLVGHGRRPFSGPRKILVAMG